MADVYLAAGAGGFQPLGNIHGVAEDINVRLRDVWPARALWPLQQYLEPELWKGDEVTVDVRGRASTMRVVKPPFVPSHVR